MELQALIRRPIDIGRRTGTITFDQLNELLPSDKVGPEHIEAIMQALSNNDIMIIEDDQS